MSNIPENASECPVCQRVEAKIRSLDSLKGKLTDNEIDHLVAEVQNSVLKKVDVPKGVKMTENEQMIVLTKANFDELYEAQKLTLILVDKMADQIARQDALLVSYGAGLADALAKADAALGLDGEQPLDGEDNKLSAPAAAPAAPALAGPVVPGAMAPAPAGPAAPCPCAAEGPAVPTPPAPLAAAPSPSGPVPGVAPELEPKNASQSVESIKKDGVPTKVQDYAYPAFQAVRPMSITEAKQAQDSFEKSFTMEELGNMSSQQVNAELRKRGLL